MSGRIHAHSTARGIAALLVASVAAAACSASGSPAGGPDGGEGPEVEDGSPDSDVGPAPDAGDGYGKSVAEACGLNDGDEAVRCCGFDVVEDELLVSTLPYSRVEVHPVTGAWRIRPKDSGEAPVLLSGPGACLEDGEPTRPIRVATGGAPGVTRNLGSFRIELEQANWVEPAPHGLLRYDTDNGLQFPVEGESEAWIGLEIAPGTNGPQLRLATSAGEAPLGGEIRWNRDPETTWTGLGAQVTGLDLTGGVYPLWTQEQGIGKPKEDPLFPVENVREASYAPMGAWHTSAGWSGRLDTDAYGELDLATPGRAILSTWGDEPRWEMDFGQPDHRVPSSRNDAPPPDWAFGPWNTAVGGPERLQEVADTLREEGIPSSAIWSEDWQGAESKGTNFQLPYDFTRDESRYPDLPGTIDGLHERGFAFLAYVNPFVPKPTPAWEEAVDGGHLIESPDGGPYVFPDPAGRDASLVDPTSPEAIEWVQGYMRTAAEDLGVDGWMADFGEWLPTDAELASGATAWLEHNRYPLRWQRVSREVLREVHGGPPSTDEGWLFFARSSWSGRVEPTGSLPEGMQDVRAPVMWGGDQETDWSRGDGLPSVIPLALHLSMSGIGWFGSDVAGYSHVGAEPTDKELFFRWSSMAAFHPVMRTHHGMTECRNWSFDRDAETLAHYRRWARVHVMLLPRWRRLAAAWHDSSAGLPMLRHPWLVEPDRPGLWEEPADLFFVGEDLLVEPIVTEGATERTVRLPGPGWWPLFGDAPLDGEGEGLQTHTAEAPPTEVPAYVRPGTALPLLGEAVDTLYGASAEGVTAPSDVNARRAALYPDAEGDVAATELTRGDDAPTVEAEGLPTTPDWEQATVDGADLPLCEASGPPPASCVLPDGSGAWLVGAGATLEVGGGTVTLGGDDAPPTRLGVGGEVWGELAEPTELTELDPDVPPPCQD